MKGYGVRRWIRPQDIEFPPEPILLQITPRHVYLPNMRYLRIRVPFKPLSNSFWPLFGQIYLKNRKR